MYDRILIVFDLDETLVHSTSIESERLADFMYGDHYVYVRPHLNTLIQKCNEYYDIAVWTNGGEAYVSSILKQIIPPSIRLRFVWPRSMFVNGTPQSLDALREPKNLRRLIVNGHDPCKVLIVDDSPDESILAFGNVLQVQPYRGQPDDCELMLLSEYLQKISPMESTSGMNCLLWREEVSSETRAGS
ncbi:MAG: HAD family hydrolase [Acidobacteria bacterium]|nr:HAD family hydrolase [Acidobacteriota bacterium]